MKTLTRNRVLVARAVALSADFLQIVLFPVLMEGVASPLDDALDVAVCGILTFLVGWHYSFLPSFIIKVVPFADMVPSWTIAVFLATRQKPTIDVTSVVTPQKSERELPPRINLPADRQLS